MVRTSASNICVAAERYAAAARRNDGPNTGNGHTADGRITVLVSHRFSTVRMADFIVVLDGAHVVESGTHEQLMARGGTSHLTIVWR